MKLLYCDICGKAERTILIPVLKASEDEIVSVLICPRCLLL